MRSAFGKSGSQAACRHFLIARSAYSGTSSWRHRVKASATLNGSVVTVLHDSTLALRYPPPHSNNNNNNNNNAPGDIISKVKIAIPGVCYHACYTVLHEALFLDPSRPRAQV